MRTRTRQNPPAHRQLSFGDLLFCAEPSPVPPGARPQAAPDLRPAAQAAGTQGEWAAHAPSNAYELRANMRNCLAALSTTTALMLRHAPASPQVGELSAVMRRQIEMLTQQIGAMEGISAHCESAEL